MKKIIIKLTLVVCVLAFWGSLQVNAQELLTYGNWTAKYYYASNDNPPAEDWYKTDFDDSEWGTVHGGIYTSTHTWDSYCTYWLRLHFTVDNIDSLHYVKLDYNEYSGMQVFLNGKKILNLNSTSDGAQTIILSASALKLIKEGDNLMAVRAYSTSSTRFVDFGLTSFDNDYQSILSSANEVELEYTNDEARPWIVADGSIRNGNCGYTQSTSSMSFSYTSEYATELTFDWYRYNYSGHESLKLYIDGVQKGNHTSSGSWWNYRDYLAPGSHVFTFVDSISSDHNYYAQRNYSYIKNIKVREIKPLESVVLSEKSQPLTFTNDGTLPWTIEDGYIQNSNYGHSYSSSRFSTTFTIEKTSKFSFDQWVNRYDENTGSASSYHNFIFTINGVKYNTQYYCGWVNKSVVLEPGTYTLSWRDTIFNTTSAYYSRVKNIELSSNWVDVDLGSNAGTLGVEVLYKVNVLNDVELLKVKGTINSEDWGSIKQMTNLVGLDLTEAIFDAVPDYAFDGLSRLLSVKLPEGCKSIGQYAFQGTQILNIDIPSSVTSIEQYAFAKTRVRTVNFKDDSNLQTIGYRAFSECTSLKEFIMPNTVNSLKTYSSSYYYTNNNYYYFYYSYAFSGCSSLKKLHFSNSLTRIPAYTCYNCTKLEDVILPKDLVKIECYAFCNTSSLKHIEFPSSLTAIYQYAFDGCAVDSVKLPLTLTTLLGYAFQNCSNLKYIELPSYIGNYNYNFYNCDAVEKVVCQSATPPGISNDPFQNGRAKSDMTLVVPSFAVVNYKLDSYWYQFGSIQEMETDCDYWRIAGDLKLLNNRRMKGSPDVDLYYGASLTVGGNAPMTMGLFNVYTSEGSPARLVNNCKEMSADSLNTIFSVEDNKWYFFTPLHDVDIDKIQVTNGASYVFRYYNSANRASSGAGSSWQNVVDAKLKAGQGYIFHCNKDAEIIMPASAAEHSSFFSVDEKTIALNTYDAENSANKNWNYAGNPYPCYYDIYYMDFSAPITVWNGSTYVAYSIADDKYALRPMQSFFVQKPDALDNIVFHPEGRQTTSEVSHATTRAASAGQRYRFDVAIAKDSLSDRTRVVLNEKRSLEYETDCDAAKFMSIDPSVPQLFTFDADGNRLSINERPMGNGCVALGCYIGHAGSYTVSALHADSKVTLIDHYNHVETDLTAGTYTFTAAEATTYSDRFELRIGGVTSIGSAEGDGTVSVTPAVGALHIEAPVNSSISVFTLDGKLMHSHVSTSLSTYMEVPAGVYMVQVGEQSFKVSVN